VAGYLAGMRMPDKNAENLPALFRERSPVIGDNLPRGDFRQEVNQATALYGFHYYVISR
jgi:hypothetical protein